MKNDMYRLVEQCIGLVEYHYEGKKTPCSGSIIYAKDKIIVATAAHCIYDWKEKRFYDEITFKPNVLKLNKQYKIIQAFIPRFWAESAAVEYDTGFLVIEKKIRNDLDSGTIAIPPIFCQKKSLEFVCGGFSYNPLRRGKPIYFKGVSREDIYFNSSMQGIKCHAKNGMSGGPWTVFINGRHYQNSITSFTNKKAKNMVWGPYWGDEIKQVFEQAVSGAGNYVNDNTIITSFFKEE